MQCAWTLFSTCILCIFGIAIHERVSFYLLVFPFFLFLILSSIFLLYARLNNIIMFCSTHFYSFISSEQPHLSQLALLMINSLYCSALFYILVLHVKCVFKVCIFKDMNQFSFCNQSDLPSQSDITFLFSLFAICCLFYFSFLIQHSVCTSIINAHYHINIYVSENWYKGNRYIIKQEQ